MSWLTDAFKFLTPAGQLVTAGGIVIDKIQGPDFFVGKTIDLSVKRNLIAARWPASQINFPLEAAKKIAQSVTNALIDLEKQVSDLLEDDAGWIFLLTQVRVDKRKYDLAVKSCLSTGICPSLRALTLAALNDIIGSYETIAKRIHALDSSFLVHIEATFDFIVDVVTKVSQGVISGFAAVPKALSTLAEIIKWGSIGGGLFILYWYVLRPADKKQK